MKMLLHEQDKFHELFIHQYSCNSLYGIGVSGVSPESEIRDFSDFIAFFNDYDIENEYNVYT